MPSLPRPAARPLAPTTKFGHAANLAVGVVLMALNHAGVLSGLEAGELEFVIDGLVGLMLAGAVAFGWMDARHAEQIEREIGDGARAAVRRTAPGGDVDAGEIDEAETPSDLGERRRG